MEFDSCGILLTENCNAKCKMCCDSRGMVRGKTLSMEELEQILFNIKECEYMTTVGVTGGEPMLYPDLIEMHWSAGNQYISQSRIRSISMLFSGNRKHIIMYGQSASGHVKSINTEAV